MTTRPVICTILLYCECTTIPTNAYGFYCEMMSFTVNVEYRHFNIAKEQVKDDFEAGFKN